MKAPYFKLPYIDRPDYYQLDDDLGKIIVLTFWTSWCPYCSTDLPMKDKLYQTVDQELVKFLTINVAGRERDPNEGIRFQKSFIEQPTLVDDGLDTYRKYNCQGVPTTVIIDQEGKIITQLSSETKPIDIIEAISPFI